MSQLNIRHRNLPDSVPCVVACPDTAGDLLILLDEEKPNALAHLVQLLTETALISFSMDLLAGLPT